MSKPAEYGDPRLPARFWAKVRVNEDTGCWEWTSSLTTNGYGQFQMDGSSRSSHRLAYSALVRDLPPWSPGDLEMDHLCRNRTCCRPDHLELVSHRENALRGDGLTAKFARRTQCPRGHDLDGANLMPSALRSGRGRKCLTCDRATSAAQSAAISAAHRALGISYAEYCAAFGKSAATAERIVAGLTAEQVSA